MTMESVFMIVLVAFNIWTIYFYNQLLIEVANNKEEEEKPPIDPYEFVPKSKFQYKPRKIEDKTEKEMSEAVNEGDVTFENTPKKAKPAAQIPDEQLDDVFTNVRIEDVSVKYSDDEGDNDVPQAKGTSFEDIDTAVRTVKSPKTTDNEKRHAGKVFHEMDGNQLYEKFMENNKECKRNIHDFVTFYLQGHKTEQASIPKKEFKVPDSIEDFNILDFV